MGFLDDLSAKIARGAVKEKPTNHEQAGHVPSVVVEAKPLVPVEQDGLQKEKLWLGFIPTTGRAGKFFKIGIIASAVVIGLLVLMGILTLTAIDTTIIKPSLAGKVTSVEGVPIQGATVDLGEGRTAATDSKGMYSIGNLEIAQYTVTVTANGFEKLTRNIAIGRGFLNYTNTHNFELQPLGEGFLTGKLIVKDNDAYDFIDDSVVVNNQEYPIAPDGEFTIPNVDTGEVTFGFKSANYRDVERKLDLEAGENNLGEIELTPAGDIIGSVASYIREDLVLDLKITVESVAPEFVEITDDGTFRIRDLEPLRSYKVRIEHANYEPRDYQTSVQQGENQIFDFKVVERGYVAYLKEIDRELHLFVSDFDGVDEKQLTVEDMEIYAEHIDGQTIYFLSTRDNLTGELGGKAPLVYATTVTGGNPQRVTTNYADLGRVIPNYPAKMLANVRQGTAKTDRVLEVMKLDGNGRTTIVDIGNAVFDDVVMSDDGKYVVYHAQNQAGTLNGMYRSTTNSGDPRLLVNKQNLQIYSVSNDGNKIIYSATNKDTGLIDLFLFTVSTGQDKKIKQAFTGSQYQFVRGSDNLVLFFDQREGNTNMFQLDLTSNSEKQLTDFKIAQDKEGVEAIYQQAGYVLYQTNRGLYILDVDQPKKAKLITRDAARYTGYDF